MNRFALVCVDVAHSEVDRLFHYAVPPGIDLEVGFRVMVPFGKGNKPTIGYVMGFSDVVEIDESLIKTIIRPLDEFAVLTAETLDLALWMQEKYYTTLAACIRCILPGAKSDGNFPGTRQQKAVVEPSGDALVELSAQQEPAVDRIISQLGKGGAILIHGVTGSGKTEVYMRAVAETIAMGFQAIVLVPEIALTPQTVRLFTARFGGAVAVTHSRLTAGSAFRYGSERFLVKFLL